jgi:hypothetical protein
VRTTLDRLNAEGAGTNPSRILDCLSRKNGGALRCTHPTAPILQLKHIAYISKQGYLHVWCTRISPEL